MRPFGAGPQALVFPCPTRFGTIDADYRGEVKVPLINLGSEAFVVEPGMRIAPW